MVEYYKIGTVSKLCGVPAHVIRFYEEQGLITSKHLNGSTTRYYEPMVFEQLLNIRTLRGLEFSLDEIRQILSDEAAMGPFHTYSLWDEKKQELNRRVKELQQIMARLDEMKQGDYYWQICGDGVKTVSMPELRFFPMTHSDHSPAANSVIMHDFLEILAPFNRKYALAFSNSPDEFGPEFGAAVTPDKLELLSTEQRRLAVRLPGGEYYLSAAVLEPDGLVRPEHAAPLFAAAERDGCRTGALMFELGLNGHLLCMLQKLG